MIQLHLEESRIFDTVLEVSKQDLDQRRSKRILRSRWKRGMRWKISKSDMTGKWLGEALINILDNGGEIQSLGNNGKHSGAFRMNSFFTDRDTGSGNRDPQRELS